MKHALNRFLSVGFLTLAPLALHTACTTTREVHHTEVRHDTLRLVHRDTLRTVVWMRDSVHQRDTSYREGTTLIREHWHDHWHWRHDTLRLVQRDTLSHASHRSVDHREISTQQRTLFSSLWHTIAPLAVLLVVLLVVFLFALPLWRPLLRMVWTKWWR